MNFVMDIPTIWYQLLDTGSNVPEPFPIKEVLGPMRNEICRRLMRELQTHQMDQSGKLLFRLKSITQILMYQGNNSREVWFIFSGGKLMPETHVYVVVHIFMRRYHEKMGLTRVFLDCSLLFWWFFKVEWRTTSYSILVGGNWRKGLVWLSFNSTQF